MQSRRKYERGKPWFKSTVGLGVLGLALLLSVMTALAVSSLAEDFDGFTLGSPDGQAGWQILNSSFDVEVVSNTSPPIPASFGSQSLRISNGFALGTFHDQLFSAPLADEAGESSAENGGLSGGTRQPFFQASWDIASTVPGAEQPGLQVVANPDRGDGARMSWIQVADMPGGLDVNFYDFAHTTPVDCNLPGASWRLQTIASGLDRSVPHNIKATMEFVDGINNDVVKVYVDGVLIHTGLSWEDYFRDCTSTPSRTVDSILFRVSGASVPATAGNGFLIDNFAAYSGPVSETTVVVDPSSTTWGFLEEIPTGSGGFVTGPGTPPLGTGSAELTVDATGRELFGTLNHAGTYLRDINALSYWTYRQSGDPAVAPSLQLDIDYDLTDATTSWQGRLVYEPYLSGTNPSTGAWEEWDTLAANARWWASGAPGNTVCPQGSPCTIGQVLTAFPNAGVRDAVGGVSFKAGGPWASGFTGNVDDFTIQVHGDTVHYNFEGCPGGTVTNQDTGATFCTIQAAIDAAATGETLLIGAGTYPEVLSITTDGLTLIGADEATVIIDATAATTYHFTVNASNTTLKNFTLNGNPGASYGLKISGLNATTRRTNVVLENITVQDTGRSGIDINGLDGVTINNVTVKDVPGGVGLALSDVVNANVDGVTTSNNAWGGTAIYTNGVFYPGGADNIVLANINGAEDVALYFEVSNNNSTVNQYPISNVTLPVEYTHLVTNPEHRANGENFYFFMKSEAAANALAAGLNAATSNTASRVIPLTSVHVSVVPSAITTIQAAIDSAVPGAMIFLGSDLFAENVTVNKFVKLIGAGSGDAACTAANPATTTVIKPTSGQALTMSASGVSGDPLLLQDFRIELPAAGTRGIEVGTLNHLKLDGVRVFGNDPVNTSNQVGLRGGTAVSITNLEVTDSSFKCLGQGWFIAAAGSGASVLDSVTVTNSEFSENAFKGIYLEKLSNALFENNTFAGNAQYNNLAESLGIANAAGLDLNLKYAAFSNITIRGNTFENEGLGAQEGAALMVKARDDAPSYSSKPASLDNVLIEENTFNGNERGIRFGEPGKTNAGPTNVVVQNNNITGNLQTYAGSPAGSAYGGLVNFSQALVNAALNWWNDASGPSGAGSGTGDAVVEAPGRVTFCPWLDNSYPGGSPSTGGKSVTNVQTSEVFCTIQSAIDDSDTLDTHVLDVSAGTFVEQVVTSKAVTIQGQGEGVTIIKSPATLPVFFTSSANNYPVVLVQDVDNVIIQDLTVDGAGQGNANNRFYGIAYYNAGGEIKNVTVKDVRETPFSGTQHGTGIFGYVTTATPRTLKVDGSTVIGAQKTAASFAGTGMTAEVTNSTFTGAGPTSVNGQNGIQIAFGAVGTATGNTVSGFTYTGSSWSATGILIYQPGGDVTVSNNTVDNNQTGIYFTDAGGTIDGNTLTYDAGSMGTLTNWVGILPDPGEDDGTSPVLPPTPSEDAPPAGSESVAGARLDGTLAAFTTVVSNNVMDGDGGGYGIQAYAKGSDALDVTIEDNTIENFNIAVVLFRVGSATLTSTVNGNTLTNIGQTGIGIYVSAGAEAFIGTLASGDNNDISGFETGIEVLGTATILGNLGTITDNTVGINVADGGTSNIRANDIKDNGTGVNFEDGATSNELYCNNMTGNTTDIDSSIAGTLDAEGNYFGPPGPAVNGDVDTDPVANTERDGTNCDVALAVSLGYFHAARSGDEVSFTWQTATETGNAGFRLFGELESERAELTTEMVPSAVVDSVAPTSYSYRTATNATLFYVEEVKIDGTSELYGPYELGEVYGQYQLPGNVELEPASYLPIMSRE